MFVSLRIPIAVLLAAALTLSAAACGNDDGVQPNTRGPVNVSGQSTCVYIESPAECDDSGVPAERWFQAPTDQPEQRASDHSSFLMDLWMWHIIYSTFYSSPYYIDNRVPVASRTVYVEHVHTFDSRYAPQIKTNQAKGTYRTRSGKTVPFSKVKQKKFSAPKNNGGDRSKTCGFLIAGELRATAKPAQPKPAQPKPATPKNNGVGGDRNNGGKNQHGC